MTKPNDAPRKQLNVLDATCIIVGIIIGAGIYESTPLVARFAGSSTGVMAAWILGGLFAFCGALCYAELSTMYPHQGGDFVYLSRSYSPIVGTLFVWVEFWLIRPGNIGAVAFVLARYVQQTLGDSRMEHFLPEAFQHFEQAVIAIGAVTAMSLLNLMGIRSGKWTQNVLTIIKVATLLAIFVVAVLFFGGADDAAAQPVPNQAAVPGDDASQPAEEQSFKLGEFLSAFALAMVFVMFSYGGWGDMTYVAAEVHHPKKNLVRALIAGTVCVTIVYVLVNVAFLKALGYETLKDSQAVATDFLTLRFGDTASWGISVVICLAIGISCLGSIHGMVFAGSRIYYALGTHNRAFAWLGKWNHASGVPTRSLLVQYVATILLISLFGVGESGFERLVLFTGPFFWGFFALVSAGVIVLRFRSPKHARPYRVPLYPLVPILFGLGCVFMCWMTIKYVVSQRDQLQGYTVGAFWAGSVLVGGILVAVLGRKKAEAESKEL